MNKQSISALDVESQGQQIADAVMSGELKLVIPSTFGDKDLADLSPDEAAVDYIIRTPDL